VLIDVTSRGSEPWVRLSPFYPHGGIPVPFTPGVVSASVEGIWQALKVFERTDVDRRKLDVTTMTGLNLADPSTPLSHAALVAAYGWPRGDGTPLD
jgi:hypothetical protein